MAEINIAQFTRPGIYINEIDDSVRQVPAQQQIINLVIGFSRKGPVNRPILIETPQQLVDNFGNVDRFLEKKGSFFHRTILNILGQAPVWALNLLATDDDLDLLEYRSIATASDVTNGEVQEGPYSRFHNRQDFWYKDTDSFLDLTKEQTTDPKRILHITNFKDRKSSVFMFKSKSQGYNVTLETFYGGVDNVPLYLNPKDYVSDYLVEMIIVSGDWSDFQTLSTDTRWGQYFNTQGLRKDQVQNFINDDAVTVLRRYLDLSLIPFFADNNGRVMFIETVVNRDTERHGIFVSYDTEAVEEDDFRNGLLDLIGNNIVATDAESIDYLSYKETITEDVLFEETLLDRAGNIFGNFNNVNIETKTFGSGITATPTIGANSDIITVTGLDSYILNGQEVTFGSDFNEVTLPNTSIGKIRKDTLYVDEDGVLGLLQGFEVSNQTNWNNVPIKPITTGLLPIGIVQVGSTSGQSVSDWTTDIFDIPSPLSFTNNSTSGDIQITYTGINQLTVTFLDTKSTDDDVNYRKTLQLMIFNQALSNIVEGVSTIKAADGSKIIINDVEFVTASDQNKSFTITVSPSIDITNGLTPEIYYVDDEFTLTPATGNDSYGAKTIQGSNGYGVVAQESKIYKAYVDGTINSGDFFYPILKNDDGTTLTFTDLDIYNSLGNSYIDIYYDATDFPSGLSTVFQSRKIKLFGTQANDNVFTVLAVTDGISDTSRGGDLDTKVTLIVNESITTETIIAGDVDIAGASDNDLRYLRFFLTGSNLIMEFLQDEELIGSASALDVTDYDLTEIKVFSNKSNYEQTVEIEAVLENNKVLVDAARYSEVKIGDFLKAYVNESNLQLGESPKRLTRITNKILYPGDSTLVQITTDARIDIDEFGDNGEDLQTKRYTTIEDYVNTYKPTVLKGFKMRQESIPDGTEARQSAILDLVAPGTSIYKGLVNRNKINWRYLVDCWGNGLTANSKQQLVDLCGERLTCLGLLSMPSAKAFKNSQLTNFTNSDGSLNTEFIRLGGDPNSSPAFLYSFGQGKGQSTVAYFFPYVTINDNNRPLNVPPTMFVANTFMRKHTSRLASVRPWTVAAGLTNGTVTGFGNVEFDLTPDDISQLNLMSANPIVYKMNRGFVIETDNTAQLVPQSALSLIHVREVLIEIENEMYELLLTYQWRFNTPEVRAEIKSRADAILARYVREDGLFDFFTVMDETNNTSEIIDAQIGVIDIFVEPIKAMGVIVNNITILRTGTIDAGGFLPSTGA